MRGPVLAGAGALTGAWLVLWLLASAERFFSAAEFMSDRAGAEWLRRCDQLDGLPDRREPAWLRQADIASGPEPW